MTPLRRGISERGGFWIEFASNFGEFVEHNGQTFRFTGEEYESIGKRWVWFGPRVYTRTFRYVPEYY